MAIINTRIALRNDTIANWEENQLEVLLKGEVGIEFDETGKVKMKIGDGEHSWSELPYFGGDADATAAQVFQADLEEDETDLEAIARVVGEAKLAEGDIAIVKSAAAEKTFHTAYVYNNGVWAAMDGNYNAENVYFDEDLFTTTAIGNIKLVNGQATIASTGKNLKDVWETIFVKEQNPTTSKPAVSFSLPKANAPYEVGTTVPISYSVSLSSGSYSYGPATGVTVESWTVELKKNGTTVQTLDTASGTFNPVVMDDNDVYTIVATAIHNDGTIPVTNRGNDYTAGQIKGGENNKKSTTCSYKVTSYRNTFYGTTTEKTEFDNDLIRGLNKSGATLSNGSTFTVNVPVNAVRTIIAYPATLRDLTAVKDVNASLAEIVDAFKSTTLEIEGASGDPINYKVFYTDYANPIDKANTYNVTI